ncbi:MAG: hypothetical protein CM15mP9_1450 [Methanobacteriota archaeon]|nr:MAG: hypothetical protein CM15mP9_1450 [Euryarchaeota archaeon]
MKYIAGVDSDFDELLEELRDKSKPNENDRIPDLDTWVFNCLQERKSLTKKDMSWIDFHKYHTAFADDGRRFLQSNNLQLPDDVPNIPMDNYDESWTRISMLRTVLDRYVRYGLRRSESKLDHELSESIVARLRLLGIQITETGSRPCASPAGRVMAYSSSKVAAIEKIVKAEKDALGDSIRVVVVTDFEKTSATALVEGYFR